MVYVVIDVCGIDGWDDLKICICFGVVYVFYFLVVFVFFGDIVEWLVGYGIVDVDSCIVVEKFFGCDLVMVCVLN